MTGAIGMMFGNRTPPVVSGGGGGFDANTQLLFHFEGADNSSTFTDSSQNAFTFTRLNSDTYITTSDYKFGSASYFNNSNGGNGKGIYRNGARPSVLACQGNFTVEWWANLNTSGAVAAAFGLGQALFNLIFIYAGGSPFMTVEKSINGSYSGGKGGNWYFSGSNYGGWHHYAFVREGNAARFYVDGVDTSSTYSQDYNNTGSGYNTAATFFAEGSPATGTDHGGREAVSIGDMSYDMDYGFRASKMDEFRFSDTCRYTSNFTPSATAFTG
jgi:hypothetical protein